MYYRIWLSEDQSHCIPRVSCRQWLHVVPPYHSLLDSQSDATGSYSLADLPEICGEILCLVYKRMPLAFNFLLILWLLCSQPTVIFQSYLSEVAGELLSRLQLSWRQSCCVCFSSEGSAEISIKCEKHLLPSHWFCLLGVWWGRSCCLSQNGSSLKMWWPHLIAPNPGELYSPRLCADPSHPIPSCLEYTEYI